jgi:hypothetical protein
MSAVDKVLAALERVKPAGRGKWKARCPAHDDRNPSLSISEGDNGAALIHCFAGCEPAAIVGAIGLELADLMPPKESNSRGSGPDPFSPKWKRATAPEAANEEQAKPRLVNFTRADLVEFKPTDWLIDGWLVKDTLAGLIAPSGACKSFLAIDWACRIATGTTWFGRNVAPGAVFYLAGEGRAGLRKRIAAWEKHNGVPIIGAPLYLADSLPFLCDDVMAVGVIEAIEEIAELAFFEAGVEPTMIVVDTVARAMSGANENSAEDMGRFIRNLDRLRTRWGCTVLTIHHTGHDPNNQERGRGSSSFRAALDSEMVIKPGEPELTIKATKCKDWREPLPLSLRRVEVEVLLSQPDGTQTRETSLVLHDSPGALMEAKRREKVLELKRQGASLRAISDETGVPKSTVDRWLKEAA